MEVSTFLPKNLTYVTIYSPSRDLIQLVCFFPSLKSCDRAMTELVTLNLVATSVHQI